MTTSPTLQYDLLQLAFSHFGELLFDGTLPPVLLTLRKQAHSAGYYIPAKFEARDASSRVAELCLNPDTFRGRTDTAILADLVRFMVHHWQSVRGTPARVGYCNREWLAKARDVGLDVTGGGQRVTVAPALGGLYEAAAAIFLEEHGNAIDWQGLAPPIAPRTSKHKFTCPKCKCNAWGAPSLALTCTPCGEPMLGRVA